MNEFYLLSRSNLIHLRIFKKSEHSKTSYFFIFNQINLVLKWDFPNVWAPYHYWVVDYFRKIGRRAEALNIAERFVNTVYMGWFKTNYIYEKYHANKLGEYGGGGEYVVQEGFGWTNGCVIKFMDWFDDEIKIKCDQNANILHSITEMSDAIEHIEVDGESDRFSLP